MSLRLPFSQADSIKTARLVLRPFGQSDRTALTVLQRSPGIADFLLWDVPDDDEIDHRLEHKIAATQLHHDDDQLCLAIEWRDAPGLIGEASLFLKDAQNATLEIGYVIDPVHKGRGVAKEAAHALTAVAFDAINAHRVIGRIDARNEPSAAVLRSLGMRQEAHFVQDQYVKGEWTDEKVFAILDSEWREG
jgi:RimJ/RimL family protein N-acetyltransferase